MDLLSSDRRRSLAEAISLLHQIATPGESKPHEKLLNKLKIHLLTGGEEGVNSDSTSQTSRGAGVPSVNCSDRDSIHSNTGTAAAGRQPTEEHLRTYASLMTPGRRRRRRRLLTNSSIVDHSVEDNQPSCSSMGMQQTNQHAPQQFPQPRHQIRQEIYPGS